VAAIETRDQSKPACQGPLWTTATVSAYSHHSFPFFDEDREDSVIVQIKTRMSHAWVDLSASAVAVSFPAICTTQSHSGFWPCPALLTAPSDPALPCSQTPSILNVHLKFAITAFTNDVAMLILVSHWLSTLVDLVSGAVTMVRHSKNRVGQNRANNSVHHAEILVTRKFRDNSPCASQHSSGTYYSRWTWQGDNTTEPLQRDGEHTVFRVRQI
jgi:hypothetical protein